MLSRILFFMPEAPMITVTLKPRGRPSILALQGQGEGLASRGPGMPTGKTILGISMPFPLLKYVFASLFLSAELLSHC